MYGWASWPSCLPGPPSCWKKLNKKIRCFAFSAKAVSKVANKFYKICVCSIFQAYYIYRSGQCNTLTDLKLDIDYVHLLSDLHLDWCRAFLLCIWKQASSIWFSFLTFPAFLTSQINSLKSALVFIRSVQCNTLADLPLFSSFFCRPLKVLPSDGRTYRSRC